MCAHHASGAVVGVLVPRLLQSMLLLWSTVLFHFLDNFLQHVWFMFFCLVIRAMVHFRVLVCVLGLLVRVRVRVLYCSVLFFLL